LFRDCRHSVHSMGLYQFPCPDYRALFRDRLGPQPPVLALHQRAPSAFPCPDYRALFRDS